MRGTASLWELIYMWEHPLVAIKDFETVFFASGACSYRNSHQTRGEKLKADSEARPKMN